MPNLPHGTVTLGFTDVEGATQLVQRLGDDYAHVLDDHRRLFHEAVEREGGVVIDARGDEFFVVFVDARRAAAAVAAAQKAFAEHDWPSGVELRVRMGLHTGEPTVRGHTYFGLDVHRAARICQAGSGGQILLSKRTRDSLDSAQELADLGEHNLPGIDEPERLFQLNVPGLPAQFPPLSTARKGFRGVRVVLAEDSVLLREGIARLLEELTPREREVLELMAEGRSNQAIAERLVITLRAVEKHVTSIFSKLRLSATSEDHRRVLAVLTYLRS